MIRYLIILAMLICLAGCDKKEAAESNSVDVNNFASMLMNLEVNDSDEIVKEPTEPKGDRPDDICGEIVEALAEIVNDEIDNITSMPTEPNEVKSEKNESCHIEPIGPPTPEVSIYFDSNGVLRVRVKVSENASLDESAEMFFNKILKNMCDNYIARKLKE